MTMDAAEALDGAINRLTAPLTELPELGSLAWQAMHDETLAKAGGIVVKHTVTDDGEPAVVCYDRKLRRGKPEIVPVTIALSAIDPASVSPPSVPKMQAAARGFCGAIWARQGGWFTAFERELLYIAVALVGDEVRGAA